MYYFYIILFQFIKLYFLYHNKNSQICGFETNLNFFYCFYLIKNKQFKYYI